MKMSFRRSLTAGLVAAVAAGAALAAAPAASAYIGTSPLVGNLNITPNSGDFFTAWSGSTSSGCPAGTGSFVIRISGGSIASGTSININGAATLASVGATAGSSTPISVAFSKVLDTIKSDNAGVLGDGTYDIEFVCRSTASGSPSLGEYRQQIIVSGTTWTEGTVNVLPISTSIAAPAVTGTLVYAPSGNNATLSATVTNTAAGGSTAPTGTVQFRNGATNALIGTGTLAAATATTSTASFSTNLPVGTTNVTATYVPTGAFGASGPSTATPVTIAKAASTNGSLGFAPAAPTTSTPVTLTLSGLTAGFTGVCTFTVNSNTFTASASGGSASVNVGILPGGNQSASASCDADANYNATSAVSVVVPVVSRLRTDFVTQVISVEAPVGTLTITLKGITDDFVEQDDVANPLAGRNAGSLVTLTPLALDVSGAYLTSSGAIKNFVVTDRRSGDLGYVVTGKISDLTKGSGPVIVGENVGLTTTLVSFNRANGTTGLVTLPATAPGLGVLANVASNATGLDDERDLFSAPAGYSLGTAEASAVVKINAPTSLPPGTYVGTLTLSVYSI